MTNREVMNPVAINPSRILRLMLGLIAFLLLGHAMGLVARFHFGRDTVFGLVLMFDMDMEMNLPTFFSSASLLFAGLLLWLISCEKRESREYFYSWAGLAGIFLFLAVDEAAMVHELLIYPLRHVFAPSGVLYFAWVMPYGLALVVAAVLYIRLLRSLPREFSIRFVMAGIIYLCGALGGEMLTGWYASLHGEETLFYAIWTTGEELLEMLGLTLFVYALLLYLERECNPFCIRVSQSGTAG